MSVAHKEVGGLDVKDFDAEDFLDLVYGEREGWVDLPAKVGKYWVPFYTQWPADGAVSRRIDSSLRDSEDLYYSVAQFSRRGRRIEDVLPTHWLWADMDETHPTTASKLGLHPTVAVESSPGRYQALWRLTREISPKTLSKLNRALSYALDADRGGWDLTQVLRIPGTRNYKYSSAPVVRLLWHNEDVAYDPKYVWSKVKSLVPMDELQRAISVSLPRKAIPSAARVLLRTPVDQVIEGERSNTLWRLECLLAESGLEEGEIFDLVWGCAWNKWRGVASGKTRLQREVHKAVSHVARKAALKSTTIDTTSSGGEIAEAVDPELLSDEAAGGDESDGDSRLPFIGYSSFLAMRMEEPKWMVEGMWTASSHGIIGGEPKTSKTTLALALGLSVASGKPFLGEYAVHTQGPVLVVQEENAPWMVQDRLRKLAAFYGLLEKGAVHTTTAGEGALGKTLVDLDFPIEAPMRILNNYSFDLNLEEHRDMLQAEVESFEAAFVILDPLYMMVGAANLDKSYEITPYLKWLMHLRYRCDCAVAVLHHMGKEDVSAGARRRRSGQRMLGSTIFHGWADSAIYAHKVDETDGWIKARYEPEFRSMAARKPVEVGWKLGDPGSLDMEVEIRTFSLAQQIRDIVRAEPGVTAVQLAEMLRVDKRTILSRVRGNEEYATKETKGRGNPTRIYLT